MDPARILRCARASRAAYLTGKERAAELSGLGMELVSEIMHDPTDGYAMILKGPTEHIMAFRGTTDLEGALIDAEVRIVSYQIPGQSAGYVHRGFYEAWLALRQWAKEQAILVPARVPLVVTGHSLGGALATLAATDMHDWCDVATFGSPRVGFANFAHPYGCVTGETVRVVHGDDVVPTLPGLPYEHVCAPLRLDDHGNPAPASSNWLRSLLGAGAQIVADMDGAALKAHHVDGYVTACQGYATSKSMGSVPVPPPTVTL